MALACTIQAQVQVIGITTGIFVGIWRSINYTCGEKKAKAKNKRLSLGQLYWAELRREQHFMRLAVVGSDHGPRERELQRWVSRCVQIYYLLQLWNQKLALWPKTYMPSFYIYIYIYIYNLHLHLPVFAKWTGSAYSANL